jgi:hypothetical protein
VASHQQHVEIDGFANSPAPGELVGGAGLDREPVVAAMGAKEKLAPIKVYMGGLAARELQKRPHQMASRRRNAPGLTTVRRRDATASRRPGDDEDARRAGGRPAGRRCWKQLVKRSLQVDAARLGARA